MEMQEIYDTVWEALRDQGEQAQTGGNCAFLTPEGKRCALGWLMDADTAEDLEAAVHAGELSPAIHKCEHPEASDTIRALPFPVLTQDLLCLLSDLQGAHDDWSGDDPNRPFLRHLAERFREIARDYRLDLPADIGDYE